MDWRGWGGLICHCLQTSGALERQPRTVPSRPGNERAIMVGNVCAHVHSRAHNRTCARTEGPTGAPHVMLTQFRSVAQSGAGIQNKKRQ